MKVLVTGADGQLGTDCTGVLSSSHAVTPVDINDLDITDVTSVRKAVAELQPDVIVNCAAFTDVDGAEANEQQAYMANALGPALLAEQAREHGATLVHISTDYVFDGRKPVPEVYREDDVCAPLSAYGRTKLQGELNITASGAKYCIVRTAWLYGKTGANFLKTILRLALENPARTLKVVDDQFGSATWSRRLALQIEKLITSEGSGAYHATSHGHSTWYALAKYFLEAMDVPHTLVPCTTGEFPRPAARPRNSILENHRLSEAGLDIMPPWEDDVSGFVKEHRDALIDETKEALQCKTSS